MTRLWRLLALLSLCLLLLSTPGSPVTLGRPVALLWDYTTGLGSGVTATSFVVQACQAIPGCATGCTPTDLYTVTPVTIAADITYTDVNVLPGNSYRYQILTVGTVNGVVTRSALSNQVCVYIVSQKRGSSTPIAP